MNAGLHLGVEEKTNLIGFGYEWARRNLGERSDC